MKQVFTILAAVLLTATVWAQSPEKMSYQAVIRNTSDALVTNTQVGMQISILQGSASGTAVYVETQTPTTNANGLVSLEIGTGTVVSGNFTTIDWANGQYFIKTETDPTGGTTYTITGTSQLLSVPYALHAKTAETLSGGITETDPIFVASPANGILSGDISNWNSAYGWGNHASAGYLTSYTETDPVFTAWDKDYNDLINKPTIDGSETKLTAGTNVTITGSGTTASPYVVNASSGSATHYVGELYGGGVVFWVDHTGQHGLITSMIDLSTAQAWSDVTDVAIGTTNDWDGNSNTTAIIGQAGHNSSAAKLCDDYTNADYGTGTYSDWYLPSRGELNDLWNSLKAVQKALDSDGNTSTTPLSITPYWLSSEYNDTNAWAFTFGLGYADYGGKYGTGYVRAVRAF
jgi:hypothetical protein